MVATLIVLDIVDHALLVWRNRRLIARPTRARLKLRATLRSLADATRRTLPGVSVIAGFR